MVCAKRVLEAHEVASGEDIVVETDPSAKGHFLITDRDEIHESFTKVPGPLHDAEDSMSSCSSRSSSYCSQNRDDAVNNDWFPSKASTSCDTELAEVVEIHSLYLEGADRVHSSVTNHGGRALSTGEISSNSSCSHQATKSDASVASIAGQSKLSSHHLLTEDVTNLPSALFREHDLACDAVEDAVEHPASKVSSSPVAGGEKQGGAAETSVLSEGSSDNFEGFHEDNRDSRSCDPEALARAMNMKFVFTGEAAEVLTEEGEHWLSQVYVSGAQGTAPQELEFGDENFLQVATTSSKRASTLPPLHSPPSPPMTLLLIEGR